MESRTVVVYTLDGCQVYEERYHPQLRFGQIKSRIQESHGFDREAQCIIGQDGEELENEERVSALQRDPLWLVMVVHPVVHVRVVDMVGNQPVNRKFRSSAQLESVVQAVTEETGTHQSLIRLFIDHPNHPAFLDLTSSIQDFTYGEEDLELYLWLVSSLPPRPSRLPPARMPPPPLSPAAPTI